MSQKSDKATISEQADRAAKETGADIYFYNGPIKDAGFTKMLGEISKDRYSDSAILMLTTYGGEASAAYRIARWFQRFYPQHFTIFPTSVCASAGTLIAIGATQLYMSPFSELGPLDIQLAKRNELGEAKSGLVTKAALENLQASALSLWEHFMLEIKNKSLGNISFDKCSEIASKVCGRLFAEMYKQIDPDILGQDHRDMQVAEQYGKRLAKVGCNITDASIHKLVNDYPSHDFVIDLEEVQELFIKVELPPATLGALALTLGSKALVPKSRIQDMTVERLATAPKIEGKADDAANAEGDAAIAAA